MYFNERDTSKFRSGLKDPVSTTTKLSDPIDLADISSYIETDPIEFVVNDTQGGILVTDADTIEGYESSTVISLFGEKFNFDSKPDEKIEEFYKQRAPSNDMKLFHSSQQNLFARAIANLVVIEKEGKEKVLEEEDALKGMCLKNNYFMTRLD